ncbi:hypothetical protein, partial [Ralstonia solanacearum]|uniref:hypothetical protein n=1 Tax=Ralstonia solanacearum TaxID=305 RepID=UPI001E56DA80
EAKSGTVRRRYRGSQLRTQLPAEQPEATIGYGREISGPHSKTSKTTPCKAADGRLRDVRRIDTPGKSPARFHHRSRYDP